MTTPAISVLREAFPQSIISYIVEKPYRRLVEGNSNLDKVFVVEKKQSLRDLARLIREIRKDKYDAVLDFHGGPRAFLLVLFSKAKLKIGYKIKYKSFIYDLKLPRSRENGYIHSVENHINLVQALGIEVGKFPPLHLPQAQKKEVEKVKKFREENNLESSKVVVLHISAGNEFRNWGVDNIVELIGLLAQIPGIKIVLIGSEEDQKAEEEILRKSSFPLLTLVGKINLMELKELIAHASLFVGPDSGPMHVAASTSTPIVAYFGPTLPAHFAPWQAKANLLEKEFDCRPCKQQRCLYQDFRCLRSIKPEEVYKASLEFLGRFEPCNLRKS